jgi:flagellar hook capping protein FlgD
VPHTRLASLVLITLIAASTAAFLRAEQLKLRHSPVGTPAVHVFISPACTGSPLCVRKGKLSFLLRSPQRISLTIVDSDGNTVRHLVTNRSYPKGRVRVLWDGAGDGQKRLPDGAYRLSIHLLGQDRTITVPTNILIDRTPPQVFISNFRRGTKNFKFDYHTSEEAFVHVSAYKHGKLIGSRQVYYGIGHYPWITLKPGTYVLRFWAVDLAGNRSVHGPVKVVRVS